MRHKHADLIVAWAEGAKIQFSDGVGGWVDAPNNKPLWENYATYRIKPKEPVVTSKYFCLEQSNNRDYLVEFEPDLEGWYMYIEYHDGEPVNAVFAKDVK